MAAPILTLTEAATDRAKFLMSQSDKPAAGIRVGVKTRGCSGYSYFVEYADEVLPFEECVEADGLKVYIDPMATMFILGSEMDYQEDKLNSGFVFTNPNETGRCGCGESFSVDPDEK
jgi:iron-sulfur cluster assembly protein